MEIISIILLLIIGALTGILAALIGIGGGLVFVPVLIVFFGVIPNDATLISSFVIIFVSMSGSLKYIRLKRIDYRTSFIYAAFAIPGSIIGGIISEVIDPDLLRRIFGVAIIIYAVRGLYRTVSKYQAQRRGDVTDGVNSDNSHALPENRIIIQLPDGKAANRILFDQEGTEYQYYANIRIGFFFAFVGGFFGGLLGLGGGIIFVPLLASITGVPFLIVVSTSTFIIFLNSFTVVISRLIFQFLNDGIDISLIGEFGVPLAAGSILGAYFGASISKKVGTLGLSFIFWIVALIAAFRILL